MIHPTQQLSGSALRKEIENERAQETKDDKANDERFE